MEKLYFIITLFALGIILGMYLLSSVLRKKAASKFVAAIQGVLVATALVMLIYFAFVHGPGSMSIIVLFAITALGGITLLTFDIMGKSFPRWLAVIHGSIAVVGLIFLLEYASIH